VEGKYSENFPYNSIGEQDNFPQREQTSSVSKDAMITALRQRIQKLEKENRELKQRVCDYFGCELLDPLTQQIS
jgi:predicted RNase H-like nuclease (RuvC/YqgF family)